MNGREALELVDDYVRGRLTGETLEAFEILMLQDPGLRNEVEVVQAIRDSLLDAQREPPSDSKPESASRSVYTRLWAIAATALFAVSALLHLFSEPDNDHIAILQEARFESARSESRRVVVKIAANVPTLIRIDAFGYDQTDLKLSVKKGGKVVFSQQTEALNDFVTHAITGLEPGNYLISLVSATETREFDLLVH